MGVTRNGARTFLNVVHKACKLSHLAGFRQGISQILGEPTATNLLGLWDPFCAAVEALVGLDNWYNQKDYHVDTAGNEDVIEVPPGA